jgi:5-methylthioadenosine/S-adenosylhomocysteine deaminase
MTSREEVLENHTLVVLDGRILDVLPNAEAAMRYDAALTVTRPQHLLMPGLVNAQIPSAPPASRLASPRTGIGTDRARDGALLRVAQMLKGGTTCFCATGLFPDESLRTAVEQAMRAVIGIPIAEGASRWAKTPDDYLARVLQLRDEFREHPTIATAFAPHAVAAISDALFGRIATLANELDAAIITTLHESLDEIDASLAHHGVRPIERLHALGLLTPALTAVHMAHVTEDDLALAQRSGLAVILCPEANLRLGHGAPPVAAWLRSGLRVGLGSSGEAGVGLDLWSQMKLLALLSLEPAGAALPEGAWQALCAATRGGAAALGLDADIGTLQSGKWADLCCVDLRSPAAATQGADAVDRLVYDGSRDMVSDVWVAGRHLLAQGNFTRLDWQALAARTGDSA